MLPMIDLPEVPSQPLYVAASHNPRPPTPLTSPMPSYQNNEVIPLWLAEKAIIKRAIELCNGSVNKAAGKLEVAPSTLYRKIQSWNTPS